VLGAAPRKGSGLDAATVASGLREALRIGSRNAASQTSRRDGFFGDPRIRIPVPDPLERMASGLRSVGFGAKVDEFELAMNRAAERAAGEAAPVFLNAIQSMTIEDALEILRGGEHAATDYLRARTGDTLHARFAPIVDESMRRVGLVRVYDELLGRWRAVPLVPQPEFELREYVTREALDGLFLVLATEEEKIRTDPAARVTELLRTVFG
jgi:hypothetical protein